MKIFGFEWNCGCPDRIAESGTTNPMIYWGWWWPRHHGPVRIAGVVARRLIRKRR